MLFNEQNETKAYAPRQYLDFEGCRLSRSEEAELSRLSDYELWEAFKSGNKLAFISIYTKYYEILFDHGCKFVKDKELVRDCLQDFFIYIWKNGARFSSTNSIKPYLLKSFGRRVLEYTNKQKGRYTDQEPCDYIHLGVEPCVISKFVQKQVEELQRAKLSRALTTLGEMERKAIYYFYFGGLSYEQIAGILEFSHVSSARRVMYRSLRKLRFFFKNENTGRDSWN